MKEISWEYKLNTTQPEQAVCETCRYNTKGNTCNKLKAIKKPCGFYRRKK